jgi:hypothetical protein
MNDWKPDRSGQFLTVVYKDVVPGDEVGALHEHPKVCAMSWSNALHDVDYLRNRLPAQKPWVGLTDMDMAGFVKTMERGNFLVAIYDIEKKLKEKNT